MTNCKQRHENPVHFNREGGHVWVCLGCGKQLGGLKISQDELEALVALGVYLRKQFKNPQQRGTTADKAEEILNMQLVITIKDGATNVDIAHALRFQANLLEGIEPKTAASVKKTKAAATIVEEDDEESEQEDDDFGPKMKSKAAASFDDDGDDTDEEEDEAPVKKSAKAKKITIDDVNDACKARAAATGGKEGRNEVLAILKKKFKTESVSEIKPDKYAAVIEAMTVEED